MNLSEEEISPCPRCGFEFGPDDDYIQAEGFCWCEDCFCCDQCFQDFPNDEYFQHPTFEEKLYCKSCFDLLYAPICAGCNNILESKYKIAMGRKWCMGCLVCSNPSCNLELCVEGRGFKLTPDGRPLCNKHYQEEKERGFDKEICQKCMKIINPEEKLIISGDPYHAYCFKCSECGEELTSTAKELKGKLFCLPCHDKQESIHICKACYRPIEGRRIYALGYYWHVEHFVCQTCQKPFMGRLHYEHQGQAYCEKHYQEVVGQRCFACNGIITGDHVKALGKPWHDACFRCGSCDVPLQVKERFVSIDKRPTCVNCWKLVPNELKKRLKNTKQV